MDTEAFSGVMLAPWGWTAIATFAFALAIALVFLRSRRRPGDAPEVPGLPLIGSAVALGHHGVSFVNKCRRKVTLKGKVQGLHSGTHTHPGTHPGTDGALALGGGCSAVALTPACEAASRSAISMVFVQQTKAMHLSRPLRTACPSPYPSLPVR